MPFRRTLPAVVVACVLFSWSSVVSAGSGHITSLAGVPRPFLHPFGTTLTAPVCQIGFSGDPIGAADDFGIAFGDNGGYDKYWTYVEMAPDRCPGCNAGTAGTLSAVHLTMYYPFAPETVTVNVYLARSGLGPCYQPDLQNPLIAGPVSYTFDVQDQFSNPDITLPLPPGWTITSPFGQNANAYIGIEFVGASDTTTAHKPQLTFVGTAQTCRSWNQTGFQLYDYVAEQYTPGNFLVYADVQQCDLVAVRRRSWGELKMLYR